MTFALSIFEWPFYKGVTVCRLNIIMVSAGIYIGKRLYPPVVMLFTVIKWVILIMMY